MNCDQDPFTVSVTLDMVCASEIPIQHKRVAWAGTAEGIVRSAEVTDAVSVLMVKLELDAEMVNTARLSE